MIKCAFFGTKCTEAHVVPTPIEADKNQAATPYEILYPLYVNSLCNHGCIVTNMEKVMINVPNWPGGTMAKSEWQWSIFLSRYVSTGPDFRFRAFRMTPNSAPFPRFLMSPTNLSKVFTAPPICRSLEACWLPRVTDLDTSWTSMSKTYCSSRPCWWSKSHARSPQFIEGLTGRLVP